MNQTLLILIQHPSTATATMLNLDTVLTEI